MTTGEQIQQLGRPLVWATLVARQKFMLRGVESTIYVLSFLFFHGRTVLQEVTNCVADRLVWLLLTHRGVFSLVSKHARPRFRLRRPEPRVGTHNG